MGSCSVPNLKLLAQRLREKPRMAIGICPRQDLPSGRQNLSYFNQIIMKIMANSNLTNEIYFISRDWVSCH